MFVSYATFGAFLKVPLAKKNDNVARDKHLCQVFISRYIPTSYIFERIFDAKGQQKPKSFVILSTQSSFKSICLLPCNRLQIFKVDIYTEQSFRRSPR